MRVERLRLALSTRSGEIVEEWCVQTSAGLPSGEQLTDMARACARRAEDPPTSIAIGVYFSYPGTKLRRHSKCLPIEARDDAEALAELLERILEDCRKYAATTEQWRPS